MGKVKMKFKFLQVKSTPDKAAPDPESISTRQLFGDASIPISIQAVVNLPSSVRQRLYRILIPPSILIQYDINPITWETRAGEPGVQIKEIKRPGLINIAIPHPAGDTDPVLCLEMQDNAYNGVELNLVVVNDPAGRRFCTDIDPQGNRTEYGTLSRNLEAEEAAMQAGLSPGQTRPGLRASGIVFAHLEAFLSMLGHRSISLEPLSYTSAWLFEKRGFAYVRGHKLMDTIHQEFEPGGRLHAALDGSTPFRTPEAGQSVRGRAWAIHDGVLATIDESWNNLRMIKQIGKHAGVVTFPKGSF
jgi:hypothetical protein